MTASAGSNANSVCGLRNLGTYVVIGTFKVTVTSTNYDLVLMRDPVGVSEYNGDWKHDDVKWKPATLDLVPFGVDPTSTAWRDKGFFVVPKEKFAKAASSSLCIAYVMFGINKPGYIRSRYDAERSSDGTAYNQSLTTLEFTF